MAALALLAGVATLDWWLPALGGRVAGLEFAGRETRWGTAVSWREASRTRSLSMTRLTSGRAVATRTARMTITTSPSTRV